jgi:hypothetical protein
MTNFLRPAGRKYNTLTEPWAVPGQYNNGDAGEINDPLGSLFTLMSNWEYMPYVPSICKVA